MLAGLYIGYVILLAWWKPAPDAAARRERTAASTFRRCAQAQARHGSNAFDRAVAGAGRRRRRGGLAKRTALGQLVVTLMPALFVAAVLGVVYQGATAPEVEASTAGLIEAGGLVAAPAQESEASTGLIGAAEPEEEEAGAKDATTEPRNGGSAGAGRRPRRACRKRPAPSRPIEAKSAEPPTEAQARLPVPLWLWIVFGVGIAALAVLYRLWSWERLEVFKMLLSSFFPLALMILAVLGSIVFGLATPSEAAAVGALRRIRAGGGLSLRRQLARGASPEARAAVPPSDDGEASSAPSSRSRRSSPPRRARWCAGCSSAPAIFSAAFALLGGQEVIENWVLSLDMTPVQFMILAQIIIFLLGWPLEWTEIIVIFMPIFIPLLPHFNIDPLFFGLLVALNLQTAFLSPPVAMAAFYLKGVSPPHVTLNAIFAGMLPFMGIQVIALVLLYVFPEIGLWLPHMLYK